MTSCDFGLRRRILPEVLLIGFLCHALWSSVATDATTYPLTPTRSTEQTGSSEGFTRTHLTIEVNGQQQSEDTRAEGQFEEVKGERQFEEITGEGQSEEFKSQGESEELRGQGQSEEFKRIFEHIKDEGFLIGQEEDPVRHASVGLVTANDDIDRQHETSRIIHQQSEIQFTGHEVKLEEQTKPVLQTISVDKFRQEIQEAQTFHDVIRLFYPNHAAGLSNGQLTRIFISQVVDNAHTHHQSHRQQQQLVGLSRPLGPPPHHHHGDQDNTPIEDRMMSDSPCPQCHVIPASPSFRVATEHRKRHKRKEVVATENSEVLTPAVTQGRAFSRRYLARVHKKTRRAMAKATSHFEEMNNGQWGCSDPSPLVVHINDLQRDASRLYTPDCTVIHKCQKSSGCCRNGQTCGVKSAVNVTLHFWAPKLLNGNLSLTSDSVVTFTFENHTECECQPVPTIPHCAPCPRPFIQYYKDQSQCQCGCLDDNRKCRKIKRGRAYFEDDVIECLKNGECAYPNCAYGDFSPMYATKGRCPLKKEKKHLRSSKSSDESSQTHKNVRSGEAKMTVSGRRGEVVSSEEVTGLGSGANEQLDVH